MILKNFEKDSDIFIIPTFHWRSNLIKDNTYIHIQWSFVRRLTSKISIYRETV